jgi:hypothetical protein
MILENPACAESFFVKLMTCGESMVGVNQQTLSPCINYTQIFGNPASTTQVNFPVPG